MFLKIENLGEAAVESFTILGLSTARGDEESIGMFGSGAKHAVTLMLRQGISPHIYCGNTRVQFYTQPANMDGHEYNKVFCKIGNTKARELSWCLEFGEMDWDHTDMALREFISNAVDKSSVEDTTIEIVDKPRAKSGTTRVFIPLTTDVQRFYNLINEKFLHFADKNQQGILHKHAPSLAKIYRKGVLVREVDSYHSNSLFDYNLGEELKIDESRNLDDYSVRRACAMALSQDKEALKIMFRTLIKGVDAWESDFADYHMYGSNEVWQDAWQEVAGDAAVVTNDMLGGLVATKGTRCHTIVKSTWYDALVSHGITEGVSLLHKVETKGQEMVDTTPTAQANLDAVWEWLTDLQLTQNKVKPKVSCFSRIMDCEQVLFGYCDGTQVYINVDHDNDRQCMLEEVSHYITGATDGSRDFQSFAFQIAARFGELIYE